MDFSCIYPESATRPAPAALTSRRLRSYSAGRGAPVIYRFSDCELDTGRFELRRGGVAQKVEPQVFEILGYLVQRAGQFVGKEELHRAIWKQRVVSDAAMSSRIKAARRAIGDDGIAQAMLRTVHGRGFSFVAPVVIEEPAEPADADTHITATAAARGDALLSADVHLVELLSGDGPPGESDAQVAGGRALLAAEVKAAGGQMLARAAGGIVARFDSAARALECGGGTQVRHGEAATGTPTLRPRIGIGEAAEDLASAIAIADRLQCLAAPGEICVTARIAERAAASLEFSTRAVDAPLGHELNAVGPCIVRSADQVAEAAPAGIPQLQCGSPVPPREPSIVLLPFEAVGTDERTAELAEGLRIDIQNGLVKISRILLIAAASANAFRGKSPESAARALGVRYVLHGVVRAENDRARVYVELVDAPSMHPVWAEQFEIALASTFEIQDEITRKVITALDVKLHSGEQARIWYQALSDPAAVRAFYKGVRLFFRMDRESMAEARRAFQAVAEMKPESSIGPTWTALTYWVDYMRRWSEPREECKRLAKQWSGEAAVLQDADGQAHTVLAHVRLLDRDFDGALAAGREALRLRPGCANANGFFGNVLHYCDDQVGAIEHLRRGIRLQPVYPPFFASTLAAAYLAAGQPQAASLVAREALRLNGRDLQSRLVLVAACHDAGQVELARVFAAEVLRVEPVFSVVRHCADQPYRSPAALGAAAGSWIAARLPS